MVQVECESEDDAWEVELLLDTAFGAERKGLSAYRLREGVDAVSDLSLLVRDVWADRNSPDKAGRRNRSEPDPRGVG